MRSAGPLGRRLPLGFLPHRSAGRASGLTAAVDLAALSAAVLDSRTPLLKQLPVLLLVLAAVGLTLVSPDLPVTSVPALAAVIVTALGSTVAAAALGRVDPVGRIVLVVPAVDFVVIGLLRFATGEGASAFGAIAVLPALWVAARPGLRHVAYAFAGVFGSLLMPFLLGADASANPNELARGVFASVAIGLAAAVVNDLTRLARLNISQTRSQERRSWAEIENASVVQQALLPKGGEMVEGYRFAGVRLSEDVIGSDFFDWYPARGGVAFTLGDVMRSGVSAGIIAATIRAVGRSARDHDDLGIAASRVSESLVSELQDTASFATLFHGRLDQSTGVVHYVDAGHGLTLHVRADGTWVRLRSMDLPLGIMTGQSFTTGRLELRPGDSIVSVSDGALALGDGTAQALRTFAGIAIASQGADEIVERIRESAADREVGDGDITVLVLSRDPEA